MKRWIVGAIGVTVLLFLMAGTAVGQTGTITGRVVDARTLEPLNGVQVYVPGVDLGQLTNAQGRYLILSVPAGQHTVRAQLVGYGSGEGTVTVTAGAPATLDFQLQEEAIAIDAIVVTALGIERAEKSLGYAVQTVGAQVLERTPEVNLVQALQGRSAGVQVVQSSGRPGAASRITIRGESSFTGSGQPLFIIDGVPVSTELDPLANRPGVLGYGQAGNRAIDFDMSNVEEISVLRGAAATALYGSRAAGGAVVIKTKQGRAGSPLRFEVSSAVRLDRPIIGGYITDWAAGVNGYFCNGQLATQGGWCQPGYPSGIVYGPTSANLLNWGPHKDSIPQVVFDQLGEVRFRDVREDYYQRAQTIENSIRATGSVGDAGAYTFGVSYLDQGDITPTGKLERLNLNANVSLRLSGFLQSNTSVQRINTHNPWPNDSWNSVHRQLLLIPPNVDIRTARNADGSPVLWGTNTPHLKWIAENEYEESNVDRWIVSQRFGVNILPGLTLSNTWGLDTYQDYRRRHQNERPWRTAEGLTSGSTVQENVTRTQINNDLVLSLDGLQFGQSGLTLSGLVGGNLFMTDRKHVQTRGTDVVIPDFYNVSNFRTQNVYALLPTQRRLIGLYGQATVEYNGWAYMTLTGRNDWSSTLPKVANNFFYPSVSLGLIFTDALNWQTRWMPYGKLRFSVAKVGNDAPPYSLSSRYFTATIPAAGNAIQQTPQARVDFPFREQVGYFQGDQLGNPNIKPESTVETELGLELRLLDNRARVDVSYYNKKSYDQIFSVPSSAATGYTSTVRNAGDLRNKGIELSIQARPLQTRDFSWDVRANWTRNRNSVIALAPGVTSITLAGYSWPNIRIMEGYGYGVIWGYGFKRNCVELTSNVCFPDQPVGALLIGDVGCISDRGGSCYGLPIRTDAQIPLGEALPNWLANLSTEVRYKNFGVSGLLDIRNGSRILNFETQYMTGRNGRSILTKERGTRTVVEGINVKTGRPNDVEKVKDAFFYERWYGFDRHEMQIEPGGFVKLREITLSYEVPRSLLGRFNVESATLYVTGRNLKVWSDFSTGDPESDLYGGDNGAGQYFRQFPAPQTRGVTVGMRAGF